MRLRSFREHFNARMQDPDHRASYLQAAMEDEGVPGLLDALQSVVAAQEGGLNEMARQLGIPPAVLDRSLARDGTPEFDMVVRVLDRLGLQFPIAVKPNREETPTETTKREPATAGT